ncbi:MAG: 2-phospho-L-lactate guanylyltransferase [Candidatus Dormibacteraeota bacterium]|nr:2-phospho-L-lactate guanylyltransferase [Candidatus Dormibacteraeota bacterium]
MNGESTMIIVLIKDFDTAKSRLAEVLGTDERRHLAVDMAERALHAAAGLAPTIAVCGSTEAAAIAIDAGASAVVEEEQQGQNAAAQRGIDAAGEHDAAAVLILSSDLPLVDEPSLRELLDLARDLPGSLALAAAALGRRGTNALFLRPPNGFGLHFGDASLPHFAAEAQVRGRRFVVHDDRRLGLDLDEPADLETLERAQDST